MLIPRIFKTHSSNIKFDKYVDRLVKCEPSYATWMCVCKIMKELFEKNLVCKCKACKVLGCVFVISHKYWEDDPYFMKTYSEMTGISLNELVELEKIIVLDILFEGCPGNIYRFELKDKFMEIKQLKQSYMMKCECC